jgi:hypothetical protein
VIIAVVLVEMRLKIRVQRDHFKGGAEAYELKS